MTMPTTFDDLKDVLSTLLDDTDTSGFWSTAEREMALNSAYFELYGRAAAMGDGQGSEVTEGTLTVTADTATIALPSDLLYPHIIEIYYKTDESSSTRWIPTSPKDHHKWRKGLARSSKILAFYIRGSNIVAVPTPDWSDSTKVKIIYVSRPSAMTSSTDEPTLPYQHRELIALYAFERLLQKEGIEMSDNARNTMGRLERAFDRDMETRHKADSRRLSGDSYEFYDEVIY